jgi:hypothetical protein
MKINSSLYVVGLSSLYTASESADLGGDHYRTHVDSQTNIFIFS